MGDDRVTAPSEEGNVVKEKGEEVEAKRAQQEEEEEETEREGEGQRHCPIENTEEEDEVNHRPRPRGFLGLLKSYNDLWKARLSTLVVGTTAVGWFLNGGGFNKGLLSLSVGTFLQAACANSINEVMEIEEDKQMQRTRRRPLPAGHMSKAHAIVQAIVSGISGTAILGYFVNPVTAGIGAFNALTYMFAYTPLKKIHWINTWVGAINGCLPPLMGYAAINSNLSENLSSAAFSSLTLYAWQITHFMSISFKCRTDYARAGYKMLPINNPESATKVAVAHSVLATVACAAYAVHYQHPWFLITSLPVNIAFLLGPSIAFAQKVDYESATNLFWGSIYHLPALFIPAVIRCVATDNSF